MKNTSDYKFYNSWQLGESNLKLNEEYLVARDIGDLRKGRLVKFVGFDDVDNHHGIFVIVDSSGSVLEVPGDFSSRTGSCMEELKSALSKAPSAS